MGENPTPIEIIHEDISYTPMALLRKLSATYQHWLDKCVPHIGARWTCWGLFVLIYAIRALLLEGWYIVTYALAIYLLNIFIAFLTPKIDPAIRLDSEEDAGELPTKANEEFRPFIRRLPEFKFWYSATKAVLVGLFCTFFDFFNIPVFWPILVLYFILLFVLTMKRQILHMIKYKYIPFSVGKTRYGGKDESSPPHNSTAPPQTF